MCCKSPRWPTTCQLACKAAASPSGHLLTCPNDPEATGSQCFSPAMTTIWAPSASQQKGQRGAAWADFGLTTLGPFPRNAPNGRERNPAPRVESFSQAAEVSNPLPCLLLKNSGRILSPDLSKGKNNRHQLKWLLVTRRVCKGTLRMWEEWVSLIFRSKPQSTSGSHGELLPAEFPARRVVHELLAQKMSFAAKRPKKGPL